jgi:hypothetical protein
MFHAHTQDEVRLSQERRDGIINYLLEWLTGDQIDSKTLGHFRFLGEMFSINSKVKEMCRASSLQGRQELAVSVALAALNMAVSDEPVEPTTRQLERKESREAAREFERRVAGAKNLSGELVSARRLSQEPSAVAHRKRRVRMSEEELSAFRALAAQRQRERRARLKAANQVVSGGTP